MQDEGYNGWKNYETWAVNMYLDGNYDGPGTYYAALEAAREVYPTEESGRRSLVADALRELVEENVNPHMVDDDHPDPNFHPLVADLLGAALDSVNWYEIADAWIDAVAEQVSA